MKLTMYMLRPDLAEDEWGLREVIEEFEEKPTYGLDGLQVTLLVRQSQPRPPRWVKDLMGLVIDGSLTMLRNTHSAALLLVRHRGYRFVLCYGTGRFAIDRGAIQPGFGLRVVANAVAITQVVSADTRELGGRGKSQRIVMPKAGPLYELGLEPTRELVRQLEGRPVVDLAHAVAGGDSLKLNLRRFSLSGLDAKLDQIIERYSPRSTRRSTTSWSTSSASRTSRRLNGSKHM